MTTLEVLSRAFQWNRARTLATLDAIEKEADPQAVLAWRPGAGRAPIGWQLMHIAVTEEIFATERLTPEKPAKYAALWPRFRGGSTPDDDTPSAAQIRQVLADARTSLLDTLAKFDESNLGDIPPALAERKFTLLDVLHIIGWHEAHHQGQAHITLNLYRASKA